MSYTLQERLTLRSDAEVVQLDQGEYLEGIVVDVSFAQDLGGYKGTTPILYLDTPDGPKKFFAMHLTAKSGVVGARPQGGDTIGISRGPDGGDPDQQYRVYNVAVERADESESYTVVPEWGGVLSDLEAQEAARVD